MLDSSPSTLHRARPDLPASEGDREPVEVRTEPVDGVATPALLLRGGRLWLVRSAEPVAGPGVRWRVAATPAPGVPAEPLELSDDEGRWTVVQPAAAGGREPAWA